MGNPLKPILRAPQETNNPINFIYKPNLIINFMNKTDLVNAIAGKAGLSKPEAKKALDACIDAIVEGLKAGEKIPLIGFGTFSVIERPAHEGINPATKAKISIPAKKVVKFKAGAGLDTAVN